MKKRKIKIMIKGDGKLPVYATSRSSGTDVYSAEEFTETTERGDGGFGHSGKK